MVAASSIASWNLTEISPFDAASTPCVVTEPSVHPPSVLQDPALTSSFREKARTDPENADAVAARCAWAPLAPRDFHPRLPFRPCPRLILVRASRSHRCQVQLRQ